MIPVLVRNLILSILLATAIGDAQEAGTNNPPGNNSANAPAPTAPAAPKPNELVALENYNAFIEAQIAVAENQKKLAGLFFPTIPTRPDPNMTREGAPMLRGNVAAYGKLENIARMIAADISGSKQVQTPTISDLCGHHQGDKKKFKQCQEHISAITTKYDVKPKGTGSSKPGDPQQRIWLQGQDEVSDLLEFQATRIRLDLLKSKIEAALSAQRTSTVALPSESGGGFPVIAAVGPAIELANSLFSFFRKKTSISSVETATNDVGLASLVANELAQIGFKHVYFSANYPPRIKLTSTEQSGILNTINMIRGQLNLVDARIEETSKKRAAAQSPVATAAKELAEVTVEVNDLNEEIRHLEALQSGRSRSPRQKSKRKSAAPMPLRKPRSRQSTAASQSGRSLRRP